MIDDKPSLAIGQHVRVQIPGSFDNWRNFEIIRLPPETKTVHLKDLTVGYTTPYCVHPDFVVPITPEQEAQRLTIYAAWKADPASIKRLRFPLRGTS